VRPQRDEILVVTTTASKQLHEERIAQWYLEPEQSRAVEEHLA
jgi:hypothetical protein